MTTPRPKASSRHSSMRKYTELNIRTWPTLTPRSENSSNASITSNGFTPLWAICPRLSSSKMLEAFHEVASRCFFESDLSLWEPEWFVMLVMEAAGAASCFQSGSHQPSPGNDFSSNGDYPLTFC